MVCFISASPTVLEKVRIADEWVKGNAIIAVENTRLPVYLSCA